MSNKLNLLVQFTGIDKLSGGLRNIIGASRAGNQSIRALQDQARGLKTELKAVGRDMAGASGNVTNLVNHQNRLEAQLAEVNRELDRQKDRLTRIARIEGRFSGIAAAAGKAGAAASVAVTAPLVAFGRQAFIAAMDAEELKSAFHVTFGANGAMMEAWAQRTGDAIGRTNVELMQAANTFGIFFNQADPARSAAMSQQFAMLAQDLASFYNVDPGTALQKLRSGLTGESEPLRDFGVFMTEAAVKAQALKMGLVPLNGELTEQQKIMARAGLIMAQTANAQGDLARTSGSTSNQLRAGQSAWSNLLLVIGQELIPALTPAIQTFTSLIRQFSAMSPGTRKWVVVLGAAAAVLGPVLIGVAGVASAIATLAPVVVAVGGAFSAALPIIGGAMAGIAGAISLPVILIGAAIAGLAWLVYSNWETIKGWFSAGADAVEGALSALPDRLRTIGRLMMDGLLLAINPMALAAKLITVAKNGMTAFKNYLGIKSPSRLMMQMGGHMTAGLGMGLEQGGGRPVRAMGRMAGAGAMALASPAPARVAAAAPPAAAKVEIHVHQQPGEDANALAQRVARLVEQAQRGKGLRSFEDRL
ncbi:MAG: hypothetical protein ACK4UL_07540 [Novosphingobium meiothermophilum]|uniref:hypothetical protein n=1 Tax=Novosphingobium TaxID=165696 RepID=UPI000D6E13EC|nr:MULTISPECIES: hypothetical protein [Novosphingobium]